MEEDEFARLLAEQEAFLASKEAPAAKVVRRQVDNAEGTYHASLGCNGKKEARKKALENQLMSIEGLSGFTFGQKRTQ